MRHTSVLYEDETCGSINIEQVGSIYTIVSVLQTDGMTKYPVGNLCSVFFVKRIFQLVEVGL